MHNNVTDLNFKSLVNELIEGRDLTRELQLDLSNKPHSTSNEEYALIVKKVLEKFETALQILQYDSLNQFQQSQYTVTTDYPISFNGSPKSQDSDEDFKDLIVDKDSSKKRRISPREIMRVQGCTSTGLEGPVEDGYNWRKYGQKDILGAKFPRAYYRCTFRFAQDCVATKQVQRIDDDPSFFEVGYRGKHTCSQVSAPSSAPAKPTPKVEPIESATNSPHYPQNIMWDFKTESLVNNTQNTPEVINYNDNIAGYGNFETNISTFTYQSTPRFMINNLFNGQHYQDDAIDRPQNGTMQDVSHPSSTTTSNSPPIASDLTFDHQGNYDDDFVFGNLPFLH